MTLTAGPGSNPEPARRRKRKLRRKQRTGAMAASTWGSLPLAAWVHEYLRWAEVSRLSATTVGIRERGLARFVTWAHERGLRHPRELTRPILEAYQRHLYLARSQRKGASTPKESSGHVPPQSEDHSSYPRRPRFAATRYSESAPAPARSPPSSQAPGR